MTTKKGEVEIQFNWILILVAGALIFLFFFSIINWARKGSDEGISSTISRNLDAIFTGASIPRDTATVISRIPFEKVEFGCDGYRIDKSVNSRAINDKVIFAPSRVEAGVMTTWSSGWDVPFRITNFLFVSSPQIRYVFITNNINDALFAYLNKTFPTNLNTEFYHISSIGTLSDNNNFKVRLIYIGVPPVNSHITNLRRMAKEDVTALYIASTSELGGNVIFYKKTDPALAAGFDCYMGEGIFPCAGTSSQSSYFGYASLMGAIFSENPEDYECNMNKAFKRLNLVSKIYRKRTEALDSFYAGANPSCQLYSLVAIPVLQSMETLQFSNIIQLANKYSDLKTENGNAQTSSCAVIY